MRKAIKRLVLPIWNRIYLVTLTLLYPLNCLLCALRKNVKYENSVLHISYMVHIPYYTVKILRGLGMKADYLATGTSPLWDKCDFQVPTSRWPWMKALKEVTFFWRVVARYEIVHLHFMFMMSSPGWELPFLKKLGRKIVIHYRGCEIRDREKNMALHPEVNICQDCDYNASICTSEVNKKRRALVEKYGDLFLVTTPDMKDFVPEAEHLPFFAPEVKRKDYTRQRGNPAGEKDEMKIVHVTGHPGIEGTKYIQTAVDRLREKGYKINFVFLNRVPHDRVLEELSDADLSIGKMKMGYYANAQIESMFFGVPAITYVRPEFMTDELTNSGFIFTTLGELEKTLEYYITHPEELEDKRRIARDSILRLHNNEQVGRQLIDLYARTGS